MGSVQCQALDGIVAWLSWGPPPESWDVREASGLTSPRRAAGTPLVVGKTPQASARPGLCSRRQLSVNVSSAAHTLTRRVSSLGLSFWLGKAGIVSVQVPGLAVRCTRCHPYLRCSAQIRCPET